MTVAIFPSGWLGQGLRPTTVRLAILEILGDAPRALRAKEILEAIRSRRRVNKVTVYRILEDFTQPGHGAPPLSGRQGEPL